MKKLPKMKYTDSITRQTQVRFGGYNHTKHAKDGDIYDMKNITAEHYPLIAPREKRDICTTACSGTLDLIGVSDKFYCISEGLSYNGTWYSEGFIFFYDGRNITGTKKIKMVGDTGNYLFLLPDEKFENPKCYVKNTDSHKSPKYNVKLVQRSYQVGTANSTITLNYIVLWNSGGSNYISTRALQMYHFSISTKVFIYIELNDGRVIKKVKTITKQSEVSDGYGNAMYKTEFAEVEEWGCGSYEVRVIYIMSDMPYLDHICGADNRIWGCDDKNIYCSAFGKPMEWFNYEASAAGNVADNSWSIEPFDGGGDFTGCTVYRGTPIFFKENMVYEIYGDNPSNFRLQTYKVPGVAKGSHKSLQVIKDVLYYLSPEGVMRYSGGIVDNLSTQFNQQLEEGVGGNDGLRYYLSAKADGVYKLFVYDLERRIWTVEDSTQVLDFALYNRRLYMLNGSHQLMCINPGTHSSPISKTGDEAVPEAVIEFADCYMDTVDKKAISKIFARFSVEDGGAFEILIRYDSSGEWKSVKKITASSQKTYTLPIIPKRCDHFKIKIIGKRFVLHALSYEYYNGSTL